jgi:hypothetical protein
MLVVGVFAGVVPAASVFASGGVPGLAVISVTEVVLDAA